VVVARIAVFVAMEFVLAEFMPARPTGLGVNGTAGSLPRTTRQAGLRWQPLQQNGLMAGLERTTCLSFP